MFPRQRSASDPLPPSGEVFLRPRSRSVDDGQQFDRELLVAQQEALAANGITDEQRRARLRAEAESKIAARNSYKRYVADHKQRVSAATAIQAMLRGKAARTEFLAQREAAVTLQSHIRGLLARREYKRTKDAVLTIQSAARSVLAKKELDELAARRDTAIADLDAYIKLLAGRADAKENATKLLMPYDGMLGSIAKSAEAVALNEIHAMVSAKAWAGYENRLKKIKQDFQRTISGLSQRIENDAAFGSSLTETAASLKLGTVADLVRLAGSNVDKAWTSLLALISAEKQNVGEVYTCIETVAKYYEPPTLPEKPKKKFRHDDPNTWSLNEVQWHRRVPRGQVEAIAQWAAKLDSLKTGLLSGRTKTKGSVLKTDFVMHEHISGNVGVGFCYLHEDDDTVTPWVLDFASGRDGNTYEWGSGKRDGDPNVALPPKK